VCRLFRFTIHEENRSDYIVAESMSDAVAWVEDNIGAVDEVQFVAGNVYLAVDGERTSLKEKARS
jgi:hypothetical protein